MITGQVATHRLKGDREVRRVGFQETDTTSIYSSVTKYSEQVQDPYDIGFILDDAFTKAVEGRPGPVLIDLPDDLQRAVIDESLIERNQPKKESTNKLIASSKTVLDKISSSERPVIILGGGLSTPRKSEEIRNLLKRIEIPILQTWAGLDIIPYDWKHRNWHLWRLRTSFRKFCCSKC